MLKLLRFLKGDSPDVAKLRAETHDEVMELDSGISAGKTALMNHASNTTDAHGAVSTATPNKHMVRDVNGRVQVAAGVADLDVVNKAQMDAAVSGRVDGYEPSTAAVAGKIPVYDASAKLPGDITGSSASCRGNSATATVAVHQVGMASIEGSVTYDYIATAFKNYFNTIYPTGAWNVGVNGSLWTGSGLYIIHRIYSTDRVNVYMVNNAATTLLSGTTTYVWKISF